jgi:tetratricopeptide (TPR) repeat protein
LELVNEVLARNPEHVKALRILVRIHWWQRDMDRLRAALERLAEAAEDAELVDEERYALTQLLRLAPEESRYLERLQAIGGFQDETQEEPALAQETVVSEVPAFETYATPDDYETTDELEAVEFETNSVAVNDPNASFADLNESADETIVVTVERESDLSGAVEFDFGAAGSSDSQQTAEDDAQAARREAMMRQELESVDFYLNQGYFDIAQDTLQMLEGQFGSHAEIDSRRQRLNCLVESTAEPAAIPFDVGVAVDEGQSAQEAIAFDFGGTVDNGDEHAAGSTTHQDAHSVIDSGLAEIFEEFKEAAEGDTPAREDYETHYNMGTAYEEMGLLDEAIQEFQLAAAQSRPGDGTARYLQCCNMLGHCFVQKSMPRAAVLWFRKGLEAPGHSEDEYLALRYELGSAYEQLGDLSRAIDAFTEVYGVNVGYREVAERLKTLEEKRSAQKGKKKNRN